MEIFKFQKKNEAKTTLINSKNPKIPFLKLGIWDLTIMGF